MHDNVLPAAINQRTKTMLYADHKLEKESIERLLGMGGAVQYLEHAPQDDRHYLVWVKTNTGNRPVIIPIEAVRLMQSQKPSAAMIASIKRQLAGEPFVELASDTSYTPSPAGPLLKLGRWLRGILSRANKPPTSR